jgi:hypothetical protein
MKPITTDNPIVKKWIDKEYLVAEHWDERNENLKVITSNDAMGSRYQLTRFFYLGALVQVSVDIPFCEPDVMMQRMLEKMK